MMDIEQRIPHRPPFLFLDRIVELTADGIVAEREIRADEPHFAGHYPGNPIMPGVLLCEATFQAAAVYLVEKLNREGGDGDAADKTPVLSRIEEAKFKQMVKPGDTVRIDVQYGERLSKFHFLEGKVSNGGKLSVSLRFALALL